MICNPCAEAASRGLQGEEAHLLAGCLGLTKDITWCDCMHRTGTPEALYDGTRMALSTVRRPQ